MSGKTHILYDLFTSPLGTVYLLFSERALVGVSFTKPSGVPFRKGSAPDNFMRELALYFEGRNVNFTQQVKFLHGTEFEKKVWSVLADIPFGETRTYRWIAEKIGKPSAARAVGRALAKNPVPVVMPCHRVVESDGSLGGYSSGVDKKRRLLDMEYYALMNSPEK